MFYNHLMTQIWQSASWPRFDYDARVTEPWLASAQEAIGQIQGLLHGLSEQDQEDFGLGQIVQEALASFGIEGVSLDAAQIEQSVIASMRHRAGSLPTRRSDAIAALMHEARQSDIPLDEARLGAWHRLLFFGIEVEDLGRWRSFDIEIVKSANAGGSEVLYKAPPPEQLATEMAAFFAWLSAAKDTPLAITAALAHLWFESIHPFSDGNGRIGRAIIEHIFARHRALPFSLSRQIEKEKKAYYAALQDARREGQGGVIDATPFVVWFLQCLSAAALAARDEAQFLVRRNAFFQSFAAVLSPRQLNAFRLLFDQGPSRIAEGVTARSWRKMTGSSPATASRDLATLEALGVLKAGEKGGRSVSYSIKGSDRRL